VNSNGSSSNTALATEFYAYPLARTIMVGISRRILTTSMGAYMRIKNSSAGGVARRRCRCSSILDVKPINEIEKQDAINTPAKAGRPSPVCTMSPEHRVTTAERSFFGDLSRGRAA